MGQITSNYMAGKQVKLAHWSAIRNKVASVWADIQPSQKGGLPTSTPSIGSSISAADIDMWRQQLQHIYSLQIFTDGTAAPGFFPTPLSSPTIDPFTSTDEISSIQFAQLWNATDLLQTIGYDLSTGGLGAGVTGAALIRGGTQYDVAMTRYYDLVFGGSPWSQHVNTWDGIWYDMYDSANVLGTPMGDANMVPWSFSEDVDQPLQTAAATINANYNWMWTNNAGWVTNHTINHSPLLDQIALAGGPAWSNALGGGVVWTGTQLYSNMWQYHTIPFLQATWTGSAWDCPGDGTAAMVINQPQLFIAPVFEGGPYHNYISAFHYPQFNYFIDNQWDVYGLPPFAEGDYIQVKRPTSVNFYDLFTNSPYPSVQPDDGGSPPGPGTEPPHVGGTIDTYHIFGTPNNLGTSGLPRPYFELEVSAFSELNESILT